MKVDIRHTIIGHKHRAMSRYYMILNRTSNTHLKKNSCYKDIEVSLDKEAFISWFMQNDFKGCSVDRIDNTKGYTMDNLQLIYLEDNIRKEKIKATNGFCECYRCHELLPLEDMAKDNRRKNGRSTSCKKCDSRRKAIPKTKNYIEG